MVFSLFTNIGLIPSVYWILNKYHADGFVMPCCGEILPFDGDDQLSIDVGFISSWLYSRRFYCPSCKKTINPRLGTPLYGTHWSPEDFVKFLIMQELGLSMAEISAVLGKTTRAVRDMAERTALIDAKIAAETSPIPGQLSTASG